MATLQVAIRQSQMETRTQSNRNTSHTVVLQEPPPPPPPGLCCHAPTYGPGDPIAKQATDDKSAGPLRKYLPLRHYF
eukprot:m.246851 g.246851  ORF g.246851 m.246851 type:complete len:77 (+) comp16120_c0_seq59:376-606(+)